MTLANKLTILRIILALIFIFFLYGGLAFKVISLVIFIIASLTDYLDGLIARKRQEISDFGKLMDPIADKILVLGAFAVFVEMKVVPAWMFVLIFSRELLITGIRAFAITKGKVLAAGRGGKHKTVSQLVAILIILIYFITKEILLKVGAWRDYHDVVFFWWLFPCLLITVILTLISGVSYIWQNRELINVKNLK